MAGHVVGNVEDWLKAGVPGGCTFGEVPDPPISDILNKGERIDDGIERVRRRQRE